MSRNPIDETPEQRRIAAQASQIVTEFRMDPKRKHDWLWLYDQIVALGIAAADAARADLRAGSESEPPTP